MFDDSLEGSSIFTQALLLCLGVIIMSSTLSPEDHLNVICNKASRNLGFLARTAKFGLSVEAMKSVYVSLVRPVLEFGCVIWSPHQLRHNQHLHGSKTGLYDLLESN